MYDQGFSTRLRQLGWRDVLISPDAFIGVIVGAAILILSPGGVNETVGGNILPQIMTVSASLFAIILTGLAIITSFTDEAFVYAWKQIGEFDNMITIFQYNLYLPIIVLSYALFLRFLYYSPIAMVVLISLFVYMLASLIDLVNFISKYALQRGEFIRQQFDEQRKEQDESPEVGEKELMAVLKKIKQLEDSIED